LAALYNKTNRETLASDIYLRLQKQRMNNPYYHLMLAEQSLDDDEYRQSIVHFKDAIKLDADPHQFYFGLAKAYLGLGDLDNTERYLRIAKRKAGRARISDDYGEKMSILARLQSQRNDS
jgi:Tfp pilus assembly protein PilF